MIWIVTLRGRRGTYGTGLALAGALGQPWRRDAAAFCVAGVALRDICLHFVWQAWHFVAQMLLFNTCIHTYTHTYSHTHIHAYIHTYMHTQLTHTGLYVDVIAKELALSEAT